MGEIKTANSRYLKTPETTLFLGPALSVQPMQVSKIAQIKFKKGTWISE